MKFERGYLMLGRLRGAPVRIHWSAPVGALVLGGLRFAPGFWLAFLLMLLAHELGHGLLVLAAGRRVLGIQVTGLGGECVYDGNVTAFQRALIAWGGVLAQMAIFVVVGVLLFVGGPPESAFLADLARALTTYNLTLIAINLVPFPPLDGHQAWRLLPMLWERLRTRRSFAPRRTADGSPPASLPPLGSAELEVERLRRILEGAARR